MKTNDSSIQLFYLNEDIYLKTGTMMSPIYEVGTYNRYDWGFVSVRLSEGFTVNIRQANEEELRWALNKITK